MRRSSRKPEVKCSAESLLRILNDILDFSKIEASKPELWVTPFKLHETVEDTARSFAIQAARKGLELICNIRKGVPEPGSEFRKTNRNSFSRRFQKRLDFPKVWR